MAVAVTPIETTVPPDSTTASVLVTIIASLNDEITCYSQIESDTDTDTDTLPELADIPARVPTVVTTTFSFDESVFSCDKVTDTAITNDDE